MIFIVLGKWRKKPTAEINAQVGRLFEKMATEGVNFIKQYWTLGKYDIVAVVEAKDEKALMKATTSSL